MSCRPSISLLLFVLTVQSVDSTHGFVIPEVDGSAVDDPCRFLPAPSPQPHTPATTTATTSPPVTGKILQQKVAKTKKPVARLPPKKPPPIRRQPVPGGPIRSSHPNPAARLLYLLLTNSRGHASLPQFHRPVSQPMKRRVEERWSDGSSSSDSSDES